MEKQFPLKEIEAQIRQVLTAAPAMLGNDAVNFFLDSFKRQAWIGYTTQPWAKRVVNKKKSDTGRSILIKSGRLRRSIRITGISGLSVTIGSDVPYAKAHNEGFKGTVQVKAFTRNRYTKNKINTGKFTKTGKERTRTVSTISGTIQVKAFSRKMNIPRRQFMGDSPYLEKQLERRLLAELMKGLKQFNL